MKRFIKIVICLFLAFCAVGCFFLVGCEKLFSTDGGDSFKGYLSEKTFSTKEKTAEAFVYDELRGDIFKPKFLSYDTVDEVDSANILSTEILEQIDEDIISVEKGEVRYSDLSDGNSSIEKTDINIVHTSGGYKYFVAPLKSGDRITQSYMRNVTDSSNYTNCTAITTFAIETSFIGNTTYVQTIKFADNVAYIGQQIMGLNAETYIIEKEDGRLKVYSKLIDSDEFLDLDKTMYDLSFKKGGTTRSITSFKSIREIADLLFSFDFDASYFVKTSYGFKLPNDKYLELCKSILNSMDSETEIEYAWEKYHIYAEAEFIFKDGNLSTQKVNVSASDGEDLIYVNAECNYTKFGSTEISMPEFE